MINGMTFPRTGHAEQITHFHGRRFGGKLPELGVVDTLQNQIRIQKSGQPVEPLCPHSLIVSGRAGPGVCLRPLKVVVTVPG